MAWELGWHNSAETATNLVAGNYPVVFRNVPGWLAIPPALLFLALLSVGGYNAGAAFAAEEPGISALVSVRLSKLLTTV